MKRLFQYSVLLKPRDKDGEVEILQDVTTVLAESQEAVLVKAVRDLDQDITGKEDLLDIAVRPF